MHQVVKYVIFVLIKTVYFYTSASKDETTVHQMRTVFTFAFGTIFLLFSYFTNISITENKMICGEKSYMVAFYATIIPFTLIYSFGVILISLLDGWVRCFSNTFGASILNLSGLTDQILDAVSAEIPKDKLQSILAEINLADDYMEKPEFAAATPDEETRNEIEVMIKKYIYCKESIGEGIWHYLLGIITILVSYNTILAENCNAFTVKKDDFRKYLNDKYK